VRAWLDAGVTVALGTDGLSSNAELDMRREMALLRRAHPRLAPATVFDLATRAGARALGLEGLAGEIVAGAHADFCAHRVDAGGARGARRGAALLDALTSGVSTVIGVWIGGRRASGSGDFLPETSESGASDAE
jgi:cytosine/adenosine deaminase-related metal-dependent hydrolase